MIKMKRGDIYTVDIKQRLDSVQSGKRLCVIVQNDLGNTFSPTTIVVPLTTKLKKLNMKTHVVIRNHDLQRTSMALCEQIFTVSKENLVEKVGELSPMEMREISIALMSSVGVLY